MFTWLYLLNNEPLEPKDWFFIFIFGKSGKYVALLCTKYLWKEGRKRRRKGMRELKLREGRNLRPKIICFTTWTLKVVWDGSKGEEEELLSKEDGSGRWVNNTNREIRARRVSTYSLLQRSWYLEESLMTIMKELQRAYWGMGWESTRLSQDLKPITW